MTLLNNYFSSSFPCQAFRRDKEVNKKFFELSMKWPAEFDFSIENFFASHLFVAGKGPEDLIEKRAEVDLFFPVRYRG